MLNQWNIQARDSALEDIDQGIQGGQDLKGRPPDRHLEVLDQWNIQARDSTLEDIDQGLYWNMAEEEAGPGGRLRRAGQTCHGGKKQSRKRDRTRK